MGWQRTKSFTPKSSGHGRCPSEDELRQFFLGTFRSNDRRRNIRYHLKSCQSCFKRCTAVAISMMEEGMEE